MADALCPLDRGVERLGLAEQRCREEQRVANADRLPRQVPGTHHQVVHIGALRAPVLVIVSGPANGQTLADARATVLDGLLEVLPDAEKAGVILGIEPLHPMYAAERSVVVTLKQANDIADQLRSPSAGVVVDAYHVWWDPEVFKEIERSRGRIVGFHVSDWPVPLPGILMGRGMMGEGVIELRQLRQAVDKAGYDGPIEVEIFNEDIWKSADDRLMERIQHCFVEYV